MRLYRVWNDATGEVIQHHGAPGEALAQRDQLRDRDGSDDWRAQAVIIEPGQPDRLGVVLVNHNDGGNVQ